MSGTSSVFTTDADGQGFQADPFERAQSCLRTILAAHFHASRRAWGIVALCRQRILISERESTICDVCILGSDAPFERVVRAPPMICIDVLSEEPLAQVQSKIYLYEKMGVKHIWLLDPAYRSAWRATSTGLFQVRDDQMMISGTSIGFQLSSIFQELDELNRPPHRMSVSSAIERSRKRSEQLI
jgi:Uma2 family endonuclease